MPNKYKRTLGKRKYRDFSKDQLENAIEAVKSEMSLRDSAEYYAIPKATLWRKIKKLHMKTYGGQTALSKAEEETISETILFAADWGFPLERDDVKDLIQSYLQRQGRQIKAYKDNKPGNSWYYGFISRNPQLNIRLAENIKRSRASVSPATLSSYFDELAVSLEGIPPENIVNYDETCFTDDPGRKKVVVRRSCKHAERVMDHSKSATSVMFAVSASGVMLAPYVVYKSEHLWATWTEGGPPGARYNRSKSGWFDQPIFEDWFMRTALPYLQSLDGAKVLIGDNLASHISLNVVQQCEQNNIKFILLPPNSTHLTQPLDVCCFRPVKEAWRRILNVWKKKNKGPIRKDMFPRLLNSTMQKLDSKNADNIKAGFKATGLVPLDREAVLKKIPKQDLQAHATEIASTLKDMFQSARYTTKDNQPAKRKKFNIPAGQSVTSECITTASATLNQGQKKYEQKRKMKPKTSLNDSNKKKSKYDLSSDAEISDLDLTEKIDETEETNNNEEAYETEETSNVMNKTVLPIKNFKNDDFVVVELTSAKGNKIRYVAKIISTDPLECSFLKKSEKIKNAFVFPHIPDISEVELGEIIALLRQPKILRRGGYQFATDIKTKYLIL